MRSGRPGLRFEGSLARFGPRLVGTLALPEGEGLRPKMLYGPFRAGAFLKTEIRVSVARFRGLHPRLFMLLPVGELPKNRSPWLPLALRAMGK
jgi:hypothetical protein